MITGAAQTDGNAHPLLLLGHRWTDAADREHIRARQVGVPELVVFLNKCDLVDDPELIDLVELEVRTLVTKYGFDGEKIPVIRGSTKAHWTIRATHSSFNCIGELLDALDGLFPEPGRAQ